jgi:hypothetical protein
LGRFLNLRHLRNLDKQISNKFGVCTRKKKKKPFFQRAILKMKPEFWTPGPNSWASTCQVWSLAPICQIKRQGEWQRKESYYKA